MSADGGSRWTPLLVLRPDPGGAALEDALGGQRELRAPSDLARDVWQGSTGPLASSIDHEALKEIHRDWIDMGWRPCLEYFLWSERAADAPPRAIESRGIRPTAVELGAQRWTWAEPSEELEPGAPSVGELLMRRRTTRTFDPTPLSDRAFGRLLERMRACTAEDQDLPASRSGIEVFLIAYSVESIDPGVWRIDLDDRSAHQIAAGLPDDRERVAEMMCGMQAAMSANGTFVFVVDLEQRMERFPYERALRELYVDVARLAQWVILCAELDGLGSLITPATNDRVLSDLLALRGAETPIYTLTFGARPQR